MSIYRQLRVTKAWFRKSKALGETIAGGRSGPEAFGQKRITARSDSGHSVSSERHPILASWNGRWMKRNTC